MDCTGFSQLACRAALAAAAGVHPLPVGIVCVVASAMRHITPTVGLCLFVGMANSGLPMEKLVRPLLPFLAAIVVALLLVAYFPELALVVPRILGLVRYSRAAPGLLAAFARCNGSDGRNIGRRRPVAPSALRSAHLTAPVARPGEHALRSH
jgi:tripartite ATP-independent transporter DctM subunit